MPNFMSAFADILVKAVRSKFLFALTASSARQSGCADFFDARPTAAAGTG
jgi:hypothetical protein